MKVVLGPTRETESTKPTLLGDVNFFSMAQRVNKTKESRTVFLVVGKDVLDGMEVPNVTNPKTVEYVDVFVDDLPVGLPPVRGT